MPNESSAFVSVVPERQDSPRPLHVRSRPHASPEIFLHLLGGFELRIDQEPVALPATARRLLAFLALGQRPLTRSYVSQSLWLDTTERHADGNLRTAIWKVGQLDVPVIWHGAGQVRLDASVFVDHRKSVSEAHRVLADPDSLEDLEVKANRWTQDLLPDWYEDWLVAEQERYRQLRLHALEAVCLQLTARGRFGEAIDVGLAAVAGEPLRESARLALMRAYIAEGNVGDAIRQFRMFERLVWDELGIAPSSAMRQLTENQRSQHAPLGVASE